MENQITIKGKVFNPFKKLAIGIVLFFTFWGLYSYIGGADGLTDMKHNIASHIGFLNKDVVVILCNLASIAVGIFMLYCLISGLYRICTFSLYNPVFEEYTPGGVMVKGCDSYPNINSVLSYRESKMCGMTPERAAELYISSSKIESLYSGYNAGPQTRQTLSFIESKLSSMTPDRGLNYLANKL